MANGRLTVADAMELKTGDFVEVRLGNTWRRAQLTENPDILYRKEDDTEKAFAVLYLSGDGILR